MLTWILKPSGHYRYNILSSFLVGFKLTLKDALIVTLFCLSVFPSLVVLKMRPQNACEQCT